MFSRHQWDKVEAVYAGLSYFHEPRNAFHEQFSNRRPATDSAETTFKEKTTKVHARLNPTETTDFTNIHRGKRQSTLNVAYHLAK